MAKRSIKGLYYITHINNLLSILRFGILSYGQVEKQKVSFTPIYNADIVANRQSRKTPNGRVYGNMQMFISNRAIQYFTK